jgi:hypothetical protein
MGKVYRLGPTGLAEGLAYLADPVKFVLDKLESILEVSLSNVPENKKKNIVRPLSYEVGMLFARKSYSSEFSPVKDELMISFVQDSAQKTWGVELSRDLLSYGLGGIRRIINENPELVPTLQEKLKEYVAKVSPK